MKLVGRVGDSPLAGAGNYASRYMAASATGTGEFVMRSLAARAIAERVAHGSTLEPRWRTCSTQLDRDFDADVGIIAVDRARHPGGAAPHARHAARVLRGRGAKWSPACGA